MSETSTCTSNCFLVSERPNTWSDASPTLRKQVLAAKWRELKIDNEWEAIMDADYFIKQKPQWGIGRNKHSLVELLQTIFGHHKWTPEQYQSFVEQLEAKILDNLNGFLETDIIEQLDRVHENTNREVA